MITKGGRKDGIRWVLVSDRGDRCYFVFLILMSSFINFIFPFPLSKTKFIDRLHWLQLISAEILEQSMEAKNRVGIGCSDRPARLHSLAESIPGLLCKSL